MNEEIIHILLVEDEAAHAELVGRAFESQAEKFYLKLASNLKEAREYLLEATPNLVISDLLLTDGKGTELLQSPEDLRFPVVVMTSHGDEEVAVEAMKVGALDYVVKSEATLADMPRIAERALREWDHINQRKQTEEELRESEERYRRLFTTISDAIMIFDAETRQFIDVNDAALKLYGHTKEEFLNLKHSDITAETEASDSSIEYTLEGTLNRIPLRYHKKKDGTIFPVEISASNFKIKNRDVICGIVRDITDRIQAEESLRESEARYRMLIETADRSGQAITITQDRNGIETVSVFSNETAVKVTGYSHEELSALSWFDIVPPRYRDAAMKRVRKRMQGEDISGLFEISIIRKDGTEIPIEICSIRSEFQGDTALINFFRDIADRKQAEEDSKRLRRQNDLILNAAGEGIYGLNLKGNTTFVNPAAFNMIGWELEEIIGKNQHQVLHHSRPDGTPYPPEECPIYATFKDGNEHHIDNEVFWRKDGSCFSVEYISRPLFNEDGEIEGAVVTFKDITQRRQAEEALRDSEQRYRELVENAVIGFYQVEEQGKFRVINQKMAEIFGYLSSKEFLKDFDNVSKLYAHPEERSKILQEINESGHIEGKEVEFQGKNSKSVWIKLNTRVTKNREGEIIYEGLMEDITGRKQMEEEHKRLENQLQQAYKMEAIGTLAGGIAHDFNNILTPIIVQSELVLMDIDENSPIRFNIQEVMKAGLRAKDLVKQILTFSRQTEQQPVPLKITPIIREVIKLLRASLPTTIEIQLTLIKETDPIVADPTQVHQVVMNLCTNAAHAMSKTGGVLKINLDETMIEYGFHPDLETGPYLKLTVSDTGHGIPPEVIDRIFEPFFTTKERSEGTGMGLSVVHGIIKQYGGAITIESELGKGTAFNVYLPRIKAVIHERTESIEQVPTGNERVLIVDDEKGMVDSMRGMLNRLGYEVVERTSSLDALEAFRAGPDNFDLIITDQTMPNLTGDELARKLLEIRSDIPIILCTGFSELIDEKKAAEIGIKAFVMKPIVMSEIANTIREVLDKK